MEKMSNTNFKNGHTDLDTLIQEKLLLTSTLQALSEEVELLTKKN